MTKDEIITRGEEIERELKATFSINTGPYGEGMFRAQARIIELTTEKELLMRLFREVTEAELKAKLQVTKE